MVDALPPVALLAGGLAKRLRPVTERMPKALVPVNGKPFIAHQLEQLKDEGVEKVVCCVGYKGEMIEAAVGNGSKFGLHVAYSYDGPTLLGTGGCIKKALAKLGPVFFVLYGDSYLQVSYRAVKREFDRCGKKGLLTIYKNKGRWDTSNVHYHNHQLISYSKKKKTPNMSYIDYGLSVLKSEALGDYPPNEAFDLADLYEKLAGKGDLGALKVTKRFYEIGSHKGLQEFEKVTAHPM